MNSTRFYWKRLAVLALLFCTCLDGLTTVAQRAEPMALDLQNRGFFHDREYFMVRSGRLQWLIQADRADLGPAVTGYLFDASYITQNEKAQSYNFNKASGVRSSALEVISQRSKFAFTAFGEQTRVRWTDPDGIPAVEAIWWADGVRVTERFSGLADNNTIRRAISLTGANLHGDESVTLRLRLPAGDAAATNRALFVICNGCPQALVVTGNEPLTMDAAKGLVEIGPLTISPDHTATIETYMLAQIPANTATAQDFQNQIARVSQDSIPLIQATRNQWAKASRLQTDDALVREVFDITRSVLPAIVSDNGVQRGGPFQYPAETVRDASQFSLGLTAAGHFELARVVLERCIRDLLTAEGNSMTGGVFDDPDHEEIDQSGELLLAVRWYTDMTGDDSLAGTYRDKLIALVERPLSPKLRDATGLVHNRREFWEQTMNDAYELAYNTYVIVGLREAAALAPQLRARDRQQHWLQEAAAMQQTMMKKLVQEGALIKRRNLTGEVAKHLTQLRGAPDTPCRCGEHNCINPNAFRKFPWVLTA